MKKAYILPIILFAVFVGLSIGIIALIEANEMRFALAAIFMEIAIFGCVTVYFCVMIYQKLSHNEKKDEKQDEQITDNSDKK